MRTSWIMVMVLSCVATSIGCVRLSPPESVATKAPNNDLRAALSSALQVRGKGALAALHAIDPTGLSERDASTRNCMLERLGACKSPQVVLSDRFLADVLSTYREYWIRSLLAEYPLPDSEAWLLATLNWLVKTAGGKTAANMADIEVTLKELVSARGYYSLMGMTLPLRELMLWKTQSETRYDVVLPDQVVQAVIVVFMDDFASLGWAGFATCDRRHSGGWAGSDRLYAVRSAYDVASEAFLVSYLAHEAQHFSDYGRFPDLVQQGQLEYRAKLAELAGAKTSIYDLLEEFSRNMSDDIAVPHSYANGRVVRDMAKRLSLDPVDAPLWRNAGIDRINAAAAALLKQDTARLK